MNEHPENEDHSESEGPLHGEFRHRAITARVSERAAAGVFSNSAIILSGQFEFVIDFLQRMGKPEQVMARIILPIPVVKQFIRTLGESIENYKKQYGSIQNKPQPEPVQPTPEPPVEQGEFYGSVGPEGMVQDTPADKAPANAPPIQEVYEELKLSDDLLGGVYANAVLIRHSASEFCFDFVANIYPRSSVNARVFMAVPQVFPLLKSMTHSFEQYNRRNPPETDQEI